MHACKSKFVYKFLLRCGNLYIDDFDSFVQIPIVDAEIRKQAGEATDEENVPLSTAPRQLVTADGTYATQSVFSTGSAASKKEEHM